MDYEQKYKEALEKARQLCAYPTTKPFISDLQDLFPELKESEDERIRKALISVLKSDFENDATIHDISVGDIIAWLEKQCNQKSSWSEEDEHRVKDAIYFLATAKKHYASVVEIDACIDWLKSIRQRFNEEKVNNVDKVEPKFKVGDWISNGRYIRKIVGLENGDRHYMFEEGNAVRFSNIDRKYHLWTIEDAKDGDVLFLDLMGGETFIYNGINPNMAILYSFIINNDGEDVLPYHIGKPNVGIGNIEETKNIIHPATKEQRDQLEKAMANAGYKWDADKKELIKL